MEYPEHTQKLLDEGFTVEQVRSYALDKMARLSSQGYTDDQVTDWGQSRFGFDLSEPGQKTESWGGAFVSGYEHSTTGLFMSEKAPTASLPENASFMEQLSFATGQVIGDLPTYIAGGALGSSGGPAAPVTVPAGAMGLTEGLRALMMETYSKGQAVTFSEFLDRLWETGKATGKGATIGAVTGGAGQVIRVTGAAAAPALQKFMSPLALTGEVATATTVSAGLDGHAPTLNDFAIGMAMVSGMRASMGTTKYMAGKARTAYLESGFNTLRSAVKDKHTQYDVEFMRSKNLFYPPEVKAFLEKQQGEVPQIKQHFKEQAQNPVFKAAVERESHTTSGYAPQNKFDQAWSNMWGKATKKFASYTYEHLFDSLDPINRKSTSTRMTEIYQEIRKIPNAATKAHRALFEGLYNLNTGKKIGPSLRTVLLGVKDRAAFEKYLKAKQSSAIASHGGGSTFKAKEGTLPLAEGVNPAVSKALNGILKQRLQLIKEGERAGYFSPEVAANLVKRNSTLLPLSRRLGANKPNWKTLTTKETMQNPAEQLISDTYKLYRQFEVNKQKAALFEEIHRVPKDEAPLLPEEVKLLTERDKSGRLRRVLSDEEFEIEHGFTLEKAPMEFLKDGKYARVAMPKDIVKALDSLNPTEQWADLKFFAPMRAATKGTKIGTIGDPNFWLRMSGVDVVLAPFFSKNNFVPVYGHLSGAKTLFGSWLHRKNPKLFSRLQKFDDLYNKAVSEGAFGAAYISQDIAPNTLRSVYKHSFRNSINLLKKGDIADLTKAMNPWTNIKYSTTKTMNALGKVTETLDKIPRLEEFRLAIAAGKKPKAAAFDAREINLDFTRSAVQMQGLNKVIAFLNPALQSVAKIADMAKNQPTAFAARGLLGITLPSFYLAMAKQDILHNSPDSVAARNIRAESQVDRDFFWTVYNADGDGFKYRVPFEIGTVFKLPADQFAKWLYQEASPKERKNLLTQMWDDGMFGAIGSAFVPPVIPNAITVIGEPFVNYNLFPDKPMISGWMERVSPTLRSGAATTQTAKEISYWLNGFGMFSDSDWGERYTSPQAVQHLITSWTGGGGRNALFLADRLLQKAGVVPYDFKDWGNWDHIPLLSSFRVRNPSAAAQPLVMARKRLFDSQEKINSVRKIYEYGEEYTKYHAMILGLPKEATISQIEEAEQKLIPTSEASRGLAEFSTFIRILTNRKKFKREDLVNLMEGIRAVTDADHVIHKIYNSKEGFTPQLKDALIEELRWQQIGLAEQINEALDDIEKERK